MRVTLCWSSKQLNTHASFYSGCRHTANDLKLPLNSCSLLVLALLLLLLSSLV
jgi:hypothetical protein